MTGRFSPWNSGWHYSDSKGCLCTERISPLLTCLIPWKAKSQRSCLMQTDVLSTPVPTRWSPGPPDTGQSHKARVSARHLAWATMASFWKTGAPPLFKMNTCHSSFQGPKLQGAPQAQLAGLAGPSTHSLAWWIHSFPNYLLSSDYVPSTVFSTGNIQMSKAEATSCLGELTLSCLNEIMKKLVSRPLFPEFSPPPPPSWYPLLSYQSP